MGFTLDVISPFAPEANNQDRLPQPIWEMMSY